MYEKIIFEKVAIKELAEWKSLNKQIYERIVKLIKDIQMNPFAGIGKPEPLEAV